MTVLFLNIGWIWLQSAVTPSRYTVIDSKPSQLSVVQKQRIFLSKNCCWYDFWSLLRRTMALLTVLISLVTLFTCVHDFLKLMFVFRRFLLFLHEVQWHFVRASRFCWLRNWCCDVTWHPSVHLSFRMTLGLRLMKLPIMVLNLSNSMEVFLRNR